MIIKGLAKGFEYLNNETLIYDVRELNKKAIQEFNPDFAVCYDYGHFVNDEAQDLINLLDIRVFHYFADDPRSGLCSFRRFKPY
ncbi:MAG: hypothetical protein MZV70_76520 [Desulfobacterales bacterium]|nr:hypothetical protein [Desulfobacterales bacterium]